MVNETHENLLNEKYLTWIINKVPNKVINTCTCNTGILLTSKGRMNLKGLQSTSIASAITAVEWLLEEMRSIRIWIVTIIQLFKGLLDLWVHSYFKCLLIPHPKHFCDLVWHMLTLCKRSVTRRLLQMS